MSGHVDAAHDVVYNLLSLAARYGFVPNGGRVYYLNRSQPPLLSRMVFDLWSATGCQDEGLVKYALPLLCREHDYFTRGVRRNEHVDPEALTLECREHDYFTRRLGSTTTSREG